MGMITTAESGWSRNESRGKEQTMFDIGADLQRAFDEGYEKSKAEAIKIIDDAFDSIPMEQTAEILKVRRAIRLLPSADRPQGEWIEQEIDDYHHYWECSECGMGVGLDDVRNFCPNCGARMERSRR